MTQINPDRRYLVRLFNRKPAGLRQTPAGRT